MNTIHFRPQHVYRIGFVLTVILLTLLSVHYYSHDTVDSNDIPGISQSIDSLEFKEVKLKNIERGTVWGTSNGASKSPKIGSKEHHLLQKLSEKQDVMPKQGGSSQKHRQTDNSSNSKQTETNKQRLDMKGTEGQSIKYDDVISTLNTLTDDFIQDPQTFTKLSSLTFTSEGKFQLKGRPLMIIGGSMHYFRVAEGHWRDRMVKMKAAGINTLDTCIAWNLHEEERGNFNFKGILDLRKFIELAKDVGLFVVIKPGPFVGADLDFGGLPSWLLGNPRMKVRTNQRGYQHAVQGYIKRLSEEISDLQFDNGGPIIAIQIEDEYGDFNKDKQHLIWLRNNFIQNGFTELLFTADKHSGLTQGTIPGVLATAKFSTIEHGTAIFRGLRFRQPGAPLWVTSFYTGTPDHWGGQHISRLDKDFADVLDLILLSNSNVNFYMFAGGTNFGFMGGTTRSENEIEANTFFPCTTSYDNDAPISESGQLRQRFYSIKTAIQNLYPENVQNLAVPSTLPATQYGEITLLKSMSFENILSFVVPTYSNNALFMEALKDVNNGGGQGCGFVLYRKNGFVRGKNLQFNGKVRDIAHVMLNNGVFDTLLWNSTNMTMMLPAKQDLTLDILVENLGRISSVNVQTQHLLDEQYKGIIGTISIDDIQLNDWSIFSIDFKESFMKRIMAAESKWENVFEFQDNDMTGPLMLMGDFDIKGQPRDTYLDMHYWFKGIVFINGHNLGRYWSFGPQEFIYVPSPWLKMGKNIIIIFELEEGISTIRTRNTTNL